jgi:hypothetical protein
MRHTGGMLAGPQKQWNRNKGVTDVWIVDVGLRNNVAATWATATWRRRLVPSQVETVESQLPNSSTAEV